MRALAISLVVAIVATGLVALAEPARAADVYVGGSVSSGYPGYHYYPTYYPRYYSYYPRYYYPSYYYPPVVYSTPYYYYPRYSYGPRVSLGFGVGFR